ncbi:centrosomal protein of 72 kDa [Rhynchocyon petersi]
MAPAGSWLVLSEERIREKSGLAAHRDLAELQSLSIPGTYQEKITHLGNSLMNLTGLKVLDLSRNSLVSLEGIHYLTSLQRLNLYYNCIASLTEVFRLHSLVELTDVDFRLNPVVQNESDYRLFVVHMLPNLRQLDDRPVRESERKASRMHFAPDELLDSKYSVPPALKDRRFRQCRTPGTDSLSKGVVLDADDEAVLNLIAECEWDLSNPPGSASSIQRERDADAPSSQESRCALSPWSAQCQCGDSAQRGPKQKKSGLKGCFPDQQPQAPCWGEECDAHPAYLPHFLFAPQPDCTDAGDSDTSSRKPTASTHKTVLPLPLSETYRKRRAPGGGFQVPLEQECPGCGAGGEPPSTEDSLTRPDGCESTSGRTGSRPEAPEAEDRQPRRTNIAREHSMALPGRTEALDTALLEALLDLVDKHYGGRRSLHGNETFLAQVRRLLSSVQALSAAQDQVALSRDELSHLALEKEALHTQLAEWQEQHSARMGAVCLELEAAHRETDELKQRLDKSLEENGSLKLLLSSMKKEAKGTDATAALSVQIAGLQTSVKSLSGEVVELKQHLEHYDKIQELTQMLQESHSSLVSTNEHLLQELGHMRARHRAEVEQLHWSYQELKKTMALFPQPSASPGGS